MRLPRTLLEGMMAVLVFSINGSIRDLGTEIDRNLMAMTAAASKFQVSALSGVSYPVQCGRIKIISSIARLQNIATNI